LKSKFPQTLTKRPLSTFRLKLSRQVKFSQKQRYNILVAGNFLEEKCTLENYVDVVERCTFFDCKHQDLNDFFQNDAKAYYESLLGETYCFTLDEDPKIIIAAFTLSNDSVKTTHLPNARSKKVQKDIPRKKTMRSYPAVLIGRLGINGDFKRQGIGEQVMDFIKAWFTERSNKTGCRFIVVDAYNEPIPLTYYEKCGFVYLFSTEEQEKEYLTLDPEDKLSTRLMFFDLIALRNLGSIEA